jgi:hypothetical protein
VYPRAFTVLVLLLGLAFAACEPRPADPIPPPPENGDAPPPEDETAQCTHADAGLTVNYPADWHTNTGEVMTACSLFDPEPIDIEPDTEIPHDIAVIIRVEPVSFDQVSEPSSGEYRISSRETTIDGRRALVVESESTGDGLLPEGVLAYRYYIDLNGETIVAESYDLGEPAFATKRSRLDEMMRTASFR